MSADMSESVLSAPQSLVYEWNLAEDFLTVPNQLNPNPDAYGDDVWYFLRSTGEGHNPATYDLLSEYYPDAVDEYNWFGVHGVQYWRDNGYLPAVGVNGSGVDVLQSDGYSVWDFPNGTINMHPTHGQDVIVGWKAPFTGVFDVEGFFRDINHTYVWGDGVYYSIDKGSQTLVSGGVGETFPSNIANFDLQDVFMNQGEFLYFIVNINGSHTCDSTELSLSITSDVVVELPMLAINNATVVEGFGNTAFLTVSLNGLSTVPITVNYTTTPLNAVPGEDYESQTGTLTIAPNSQTGTISIPIINDALNERDEAFLVTLSDPVNATLDPNVGAGQVVITDTWQAFVTSTLPAGVENLKLSGTGDINGSGNAGDNVLTGNNGKNLLSGKAGNDTLRGGLGKDSLNGGAGNDLLVGGLDKDALRGGSGNDRFSYTKLEDSLLSGFDKVADFNANEDRFVVKTLPTLFTANAGNVARLKEADLQALLTPDVLANLGDVAQFTYGARTFIAINNVVAGFQGSGDAIVELATNGLTGVLSQGNFALS